MIAADGQVIGQITALFLDSDAWKVESLQVKLRKEIADQLGANRSIFHAGTLEIPVRMIQSAGDAVILTVPVEGLRQVLPNQPDAAAKSSSAETPPESAPPKSPSKERGAAAKGSHRSA